MIQADVCCCSAYHYGDSAGYDNRELLLFVPPKQSSVDWQEASTLLLLWHGTAGSLLHRHQRDAPELARVRFSRSKEIDVSRLESCGSCTGIHMMCLIWLVCAPHTARRLT